MRENSSSPAPPPFLPRPRRRYGYGLPGYLFKYLINTCNKQLTTCEWWVNFTTADRLSNIQKKKYDIGTENPNFFFPEW